MSAFTELYNGDISYYRGEVKGWTKNYLYYFRKSSICTNRLLGYYYRWRFRKLSEKHGMEIANTTKIGKGLNIAKCTVRREYKQHCKVKS